MYFESRCQSSREIYKTSKLVCHDNFSSGLSQWAIEVEPSQHSEVKIKNKKLLIDVDGGATVWLRQKLTGNVMIEYTRKVIVGSGRNDRLSDLNMFWMANDTHNDNLFTRMGAFREYDSLLLYYVGMGGNTNTTTRLRKYEGNGARTLLQEHLDSAHLLQPNHEYQIRIISFNGVQEFYVDDKHFFTFKDPQPITSGYFGFRTVQSKQEIDNFKVYELK